jgi:hypothetical protein
MGKMLEAEVSYRQEEEDSISKCRKLKIINCPIESWIFQVQSIPTRYAWGNPGDVMMPKGCVTVTAQSGNLDLKQNLLIHLKKIHT